MVDLFSDFAEYRRLFEYKSSESAEYTLKIDSARRREIVAASFFVGLISFGFGGMALFSHLVKKEITKLNAPSSENSSAAHKAEGTAAKVLKPKPSLSATTTGNADTEVETSGSSASAVVLPKHGVIRIGNSCYLIAALQAMLSLPSFRARIAAAVPKEDKPVTGIMLLHLRKFIEVYDRQERVADIPKELGKIVRELQTELTENRLFRDFSDESGRPDQLDAFRDASSILQFTLESTLDIAISAFKTTTYHFQDFGELKVTVEGKVLHNKKEVPVQIDRAIEIVEQIIQDKEAFDEKTEHLIKAWYAPSASKPRNERLRKKKLQSLRDLTPEMLEGYCKLLRSDSLEDRCEGARKLRNTQIYDILSRSSASDDKVQLIKKLQDILLLLLYLSERRGRLSTFSQTCTQHSNQQFIDGLIHQEEDMNFSRVALTCRKREPLTKKITESTFILPEVLTVVREDGTSRLAGYQYHAHASDQELLLNDHGGLKKKYELKAILQNQGNTHWAAYLRRGEEWYYCDDSRVEREVSFETIGKGNSTVFLYHQVKCTS